MPDSNTSPKTVGRLSLYRRVLDRLAVQDVASVYSHDFADAVGVSAAQVRRDVMAVGYAGSPTRGYVVAELAESIGRYLDAPKPQNVAVIGVGNIGRAVLSYFSGRHSNLKIVAAFDCDPLRTGRVVHGVRSYDIAELTQRIEELRINVAVVAVPASEAQAVADRLIANGVRGLLNFAPTPLRATEGVYVEDVDITTLIEKVAFFAR